MAWLAVGSIPAVGCLLFAPFLASNTRLTKLGPNSAGSNRHHDGLHRADFIIGYALLFGDAKVVLHSRIASNCHRCCQVE